ncbi:MFS amine transporter [Aspergillus sclerotioniger CBS 115572]|uniref:MFS amine transporter n=1 Tax=Aspergillus sclerotioniger CBS 115572 TaxID=1450535 RepID=A0A317V2R4_9EURO|nr:MFS amine transporter [Aspergillus sclerotioniger CBS 115572]PWY67082.1 MFS amine transporter [Aspergillus sclerotioniger CBS 115572]
MSVQKLRSSTPFAVIVVCVAVFTDIFLYGLVVPMLPFALADRVGLSDGDIQRWNSILLATYGAAIMLGSLLFGWMGDQTRTKQLPFLLGVGVMGGATLLFSLTTSLLLIILARVLQGCSTAIVFTIGFSLLLDTVGDRHIGRAIGFTSMSLSVGLFAGPIVGGFLYDLAGYFAVFIPAFVLVALEFLLRMLLITPRHDPEVKQPITDEDQRPLIPGTAGRQSPRTPAVFTLMRTPRFAVAMLGMFMLNSFMTAYEAVLPVYLPEVFFYRSTQIAIVFLSNTLPMICSPVGGSLVDHLGPFWPAVLGFGLITPSMMLLSLIRVPGTLHSVLLRLFLFLFGCGVSVAMPAMMTEITLAKDAMEEGEPGIFGDRGACSQAYGLSNAAFAGGTLVGPLYAGYMREAAGWTAMNISLGVFSGLMVVLIIMFTPRKRPGVVRRTRA